MLGGAWVQFTIAFDINRLALVLYWTLAMKSNRPKKHANKKFRKSAEKSLVGEQTFVALWIAVLVTIAILEPNNALTGLIAFLSHLAKLR